MASCQGHDSDRPLASGGTTEHDELRRYNRARECKLDMLVSDSLPHVSVIRPSYTRAVFFRARLWRLSGHLDSTFHFALASGPWVRVAALLLLPYLQSVWAGFRIHVQGMTLAAADRYWPVIVRVHRREGKGMHSAPGLRHLLRKGRGLFDRHRHLMRLWRERWRSPDRVL